MAFPERVDILKNHLGSLFVRTLFKCAPSIPTPIVKAVIRSSWLAVTCGKKWFSKIFEVSHMPFSLLADPLKRSSYLMYVVVL